MLTVLTGLLVPAFLLLKLPTIPNRVTRSGEITPPSVPAVTLAVTEPSYILSVTVVPVRVNVLAVMLALADPVAATV